jgi:hypothetical protein
MSDVVRLGPLASSSDDHPARRTYGGDEPNMSVSKAITTHNLSLFVSLLLLRHTTLINQIRKHSLAAF